MVAASFLKPAVEVLVLSLPSPRLVRGQVWRGRRLLGLQAASPRHSAGYNSGDAGQCLSGLQRR